MNGKLNLANISVFNIKHRTATKLDTPTITIIEILKDGLPVNFIAFFGLPYLQVSLFVSQNYRIIQNVR